MIDNTFGVEFENYLPDGATHAQLAAAITARLGGRGVCHAESWNHLTRPHWKIVTDGSLDDYVRGNEVVSPVLSGEAGFAAIDAVMDAMTDFGCTVSKKCGLHVHIGVGRDPGLQFFKNLLKIYRHFEPVIDSFMPLSRRLSANPFIRSMTYITDREIDRAVNYQGLLRLLGRTRDPRYHKINIAAHAKYTTVEFRQHSGTLDAAKIKQWVLFCNRMVEAAKRGDVPRTAGGEAAPANAARPGTKAYQVGQMLLRPEGTTRSEVCARFSWPSVSMQDQAQMCGLTLRTIRIGRVVHYYAQAAAPAVATPATLDGLFVTLGCDAEQQAYFRARTANLAGPVVWAA